MEKGKRSSRTPAKNLSEDGLKDLISIDEEKLAKSSEALAEQKANTLSLLHELLEKHPKDFARLVCEGLLAEPGTQVPFCVPAGRDYWGHEYIERSRQRYSYLAALMLRKLNGEKGEISKFDYISLAQWIEYDCYFYTEFFRKENYSSPTLDDIWRAFFQGLAGDLSVSVAKATEFIYHGVPLYVKGDHENNYHLLPRENEEYSYIRQRGKRWDVTHDDLLPDWASRYFVKPEHLKWHDLLFLTESVLSESEILERQKALWRQIGLEPAISEFGVEERDKGEWPEELDIALITWRAARNSVEVAEGAKPRAYMLAWLETNYPNLSDEARRRIATVANWDKTPGQSKKSPT